MPDDSADSSPPATPGKVQVSCSPGFLDWLEVEGISVAFTTYQTNRLFLVGRSIQGGRARLSAFERLLDRPMGLAASADRLWVATRFQLWRFDQVLAPGDRHEGRDRLYVPRIGHVTGEVDAHDVHFAGGAGSDTPGGAGEVLFVNTLYNCLAKLSDRHSFEPVWTPPWISKLVPEDRGHLNGLAMDGGRPRFVTSVARTDTRQGWREHRADGGVVVDVESGEVVVSGLSMPHSPRLHDGELYVFDSGNGELARVDVAAGRAEPIAFCPGYLRGLAFRGRHALVGLSKPRDKTFRGLPLDQRLADAQADPVCGLRVIDLESGRGVHELTIHGVVSELYDVAILPDTERPMALGFKSDEIRRILTFEEDGEVTRHTLRRLEAGEAIHGGAPLPERHRQGEGPGRPAGGGAAAAAGDGAVPGKLAARTREVSLAEALTHADLTFPDLRRTAVSRPLREPLLITVLEAASEEGGTSGSNPLAVAVTNLRPGGRSAEVVSLAVRSSFRRRGLGKLLLQALEGDLARRGVESVDLVFRDSWTDAPALRRLLAARGWSTPKTQVLLAAADRKVMEQPWLEERPLPEGYEIFPWKELTSGERRNIVRRQQREEWYPETLSPFQMEDRIAEDVAVGLRHRGRVVGWLITHRVADEVIQYTSLFVAPGDGGSGPLAKLGKGLPLIAAAARRQLASGVPRAIFMVQVENRAMRRLLDRRLAPHLSERAELLRSGKRLPAAAPTAS